MENLPEYNGTDPISLIPYGLPQFLDFQAEADLLKKINRVFCEEEQEISANGEIVKDTKLCELKMHPTEGYLLKPGSDTEEYTGDHYYQIDPEKHLGPWLDTWIPIPFLRETGDSHREGEEILPTFIKGPSNWARAYMTRINSDNPEAKKDWRVVIAFDMQVEDIPGKHSALSQDDVQARAVCSLAYRKEDNAWFVMQDWIKTWLKKDLWEPFYELKKNGKFVNDRVRVRWMDDEEVPPKEVPTAYFASYLVYLEVLQKIMRYSKVRIVNISGTQEEAGDAPSGNQIEVDLVLDIGNSRSTGILVESEKGKNPDLNVSYRLQLRDLSRPYLWHSEPFETRVEFAKAEFGNAKLSRRSGRRSTAFTWASPVRTGPEAVHLAAKAANGEGSSGMSSPKRYLWSQEEGTLWYFNRSQNDDREEIVTSAPLCRFVNNAGLPIKFLQDLADTSKRPGLIATMFKENFSEVIAEIIKDGKFDAATQPRFSPSSLMMLLFMELIQQALVTINSPAQRYRRGLPDCPRHLRSIVFTVPPGMAQVEQDIYKTWACASVHVLWQILGWKNFYKEQESLRRYSSSYSFTNDYRMSPEVKCDWDEATCTQLVYLYNEVVRNFEGDARLFFEINGKIRNVPQEDDIQGKKTDSKPTIRIAAIDIGGGTTDLSVTTYVLANDASSTDRIWPKQEICDGFNVGGDDVLKSLITDVIFKAFRVSLEKQGVPRVRADSFFRELFGKKSDNIRTQNLRKNFIRQVAMPLTYAVLALYEQKDFHDTNGELTLTPKYLYDGSCKYDKHTYDYPIAGVVDYINEEIERRSGRNMDFMNMPLSISYSEIDNVISRNIRPVLLSMGELVYKYDCDVLLLSGRPSCWNAMVRELFKMIPISPDRIIPMNKYKVGPWYPFSDSTGTITDPKTTVVTGAILCRLAESSIEGFVFNSGRLKLKSTARYIGQLDTQGVLSKEKVWFDLSDGTYRPDGWETTIDFSAPLSIGFRQISAERWTTNKCWRMDFADENARRMAQDKTPYKVKVRFEIRDPEGDETSHDPKFKLNQPKIDPNDSEAILDRNGEPVRGKPIKIKLRTISNKNEEEGCWMDTAILYD